MGRMKTAVDIKICSIESCGKPVRAKALCATHHQQWRRTGLPEPIPKEPKVRKLKCIRRGCKGEGKMELDRFCENCFDIFGIAYRRRKQNNVD